MKIDFVINNYIGLFCDENKISLYISTESGVHFILPDDTAEPDDINSISAGAIVAIALTGAAVFLICIYCAGRMFMSPEPRTYKEHTNIRV